MQEELITYLKDVYQEKNRLYQQILKTTKWGYTVMLFFVIFSSIGIWLMYHGVIITDSLASWVDALVFFFAVSFLITNILMINIHKEPKTTLALNDDLDIGKNYQQAIQSLKELTEKLHRFSIGLLVTSVISIFCLVLIILFII